MKEKPVVKILSDAEMVKLWMAVEESCVLDQAIMSVLYQGIRLNELCKLEVEDVKLNERQLLVYGRRGTKIVYFDEKCRVYLEDYLNQHPTKKGVLFLSENGKPLTSHFIYRLVSNLGKRAGIELVPSDLRRRCVIDKASISIDYSGDFKNLSDRDRMLSILYSTGMRLSEIKTLMLHR